MSFYYTRWLTIPDTIEQYDINGTPHISCRQYLLSLLDKSGQLSDATYSSRAGELQKKIKRDKPGLVLVQSIGPISNFVSVENLDVIRKLAKEYSGSWFEPIKAKEETVVTEMPLFPAHEDPNHFLTQSELFSAYIFRSELTQSHPRETQWNEFLEKVEELGYKDRHGKLLHGVYCSRSDPTDVHISYQTPETLRNILYWARGALSFGPFIPVDESFSPLLSEKDNKGLSLIHRTAASFQDPDQNGYPYHDVVSFLKKNRVFISPDALALELDDVVSIETAQLGLDRRMFLEYSQVLDFEGVTGALMEKGFPGARVLELEDQIKLVLGEPTIEDSWAKKLVIDKKWEDIERCFTFD